MGFYLCIFIPKLVNIWNRISRLENMVEIGFVDKILDTYA